MNDVEARNIEFRYALQVYPVLTETGEKVAAKVVEIIAMPVNQLVGDEFTQVVDERHKMRWSSRYQLFKRKPYDPLQDVTLCFPYCLPEVKDYIRYTCKSLLDLAALPDEPKELIEGVEDEEVKVSLLENVQMLKRIGQALLENSKIEKEEKTAVKR